MLGELCYAEDLAEMSREFLPDVGSANQAGANAWAPMAILPFWEEFSSRQEGVEPLSLTPARIPRPRAPSPL